MNFVTWECEDTRVEERLKPKFMRVYYRASQRRGYEVNEDNKELTSAINHEQ